jgi:hypothetical protein
LRRHDRAWRWLAGHDRAGRPGLPFDEALAPVPVLALIVLVLNDRVLKVHAPSALTGKLSDVAGLAVAPLVLTAAIDCALHLAARLGAPLDWTLRRWKLLAAIGATGGVFIAVKLWAPAARALADALAGVFGQAAIVTDPTDLLTLPALAVAWWHGRRTLAHVPYGRVAWAQRRDVPGDRALADVRAAGADPAAVAALAQAIDERSAPDIDRALAALR